MMAPQFPEKLNKRKLSKNKSNNNNKGTGKSIRTSGNLRDSIDDARAKERGVDPRTSGILKKKKITEEHLAQLEIA